MVFDTSQDLRVAGREKTMTPDLMCTVAMANFAP